MNKEGSFKPVVIVLVISMLIAFFWNSLTFLKDGVHAVLNPTLGALINWNVNIGMSIVVLLITVVTTVVQKYTTDQEALKDLKKQQKEMNEKAKQHRSDPQKMLEIQKEMAPLSIKMMKLSMRAFVFTAIPLLLFIRWFVDFFTSIGNPKIFGFFSWLWFYILFSLIVSAILRKIMKIV
ncbi:MAG: EMC3/TMCO1 family protein [Nanoarchaeota archaeon]